MSIQVQNHWFFSCITVVFGFELIRSVPWIPLPTSLAWEPEWNLWIERSRLFCYSVINLLCCFQCESFYILSHRFVFVKNFFNLFFRSSCLSQATRLFYYIRNKLSSIFLFFFLSCFNDLLHASKQFFPNQLNTGNFKSKRIIRRRRDLNPRTAWTVYTLSRGTSSATWVLLHMPKYNKIFNSTYANA